MSQRLISLFALLVLLVAGAALTPIATAATDTMPVDETAVVYQDDGADTDTGTDNGGTDGDIFDSVGAIFAVLGVYVVTMFTMAIGTEILVDVFKGILGKPLGLKNKPKAKEKLAQYEVFLQGSLQDLGVSADAKLRIEKQIVDLKNLLEPAFTAEEVVMHLRREEFNAALATLGLTGTDHQLIGEVADDVKAVTNTHLTAVIDSLDERTTLGKTVKAALRRSNLDEKVNKQIDRLERTAVAVTADDVYYAVNELINGEIADSVTDWATAFMKGLRDETYDAARSKYENSLKPQIKAFGLGPKLEQEIEAQFETFLKRVETYHATDTYLESLNEFLLDLEEQRNKARSAIGKWIDAGIEWVKKQLRRSPLQGEWLDPAGYDPIIEDSTKAASKLIDLEMYDKEQANKRVRRLRLTAVALGILLAYFLQIDSADLLQDLFPADANFLYITLIPQSAALFAWIERTFSIPTYDLTAGIILTGLAASAGSSFWHDQLSRLQAAKKGVEVAEETLRPLIQQVQARRETEN